MHQIRVHLQYLGKIQQYFSFKLLKQFIFHSLCKRLVIPKITKEDFNSNILIHLVFDWLSMYILIQYRIHLKMFILKYFIMKLQ